MGMSHIGLRELVRQTKKRHPLFRQTMENGEGLCLFVNKSRTSCKMLSASGNVVGYLKLDYPLTESAIEEIPGSFGGSIAYSQAAKAALMKLLLIDSSTAKKRVSYVDTARLVS